LTPRSWWSPPSPIWTSASARCSASWKACPCSRAPRSRWHWSCAAMDRCPRPRPRPCPARTVRAAPSPGAAVLRRRRAPVRRSPPRRAGSRGRPPAWRPLGRPHRAVVPDSRRHQLSVGKRLCGHGERCPGGPREPRLQPRRPGRLTDARMTATGTANARPMGRRRDRGRDPGSQAAAACTSQYPLPSLAVRGARDGGKA